MINEDLGVFVSAAGSDDEGSGTPSEPFQTLYHALVQAQAANKRVYVCATAGSFAELLTIDSQLDGIEIYGGFDCSEEEWTYSTEHRAKLQPGAQPK